MSYSCGKNTWVDLYTKPLLKDQPYTKPAEEWIEEPFQSAAGRHVFRHNEKAYGWNSDRFGTFVTARVGPYSKEFPAVTIFGGADCSGPSARLYTNIDPDASGAQYLRS